MSYRILLILLCLAGCGGGDDRREAYVSCFAEYYWKICAQDVPVACATYSTTDPACKAIR